MMEPDVSFEGIQLLPGKPVSVNDVEDSESRIWTLHITQFALAKNPKPGRNTVSIIKDDGRDYVLGTLEKGRCEQFQADFMISESVQLITEGDSEVHLTGYKTTTELLDPDAEELLGDSDDEDEDEDFEDELQRRAISSGGKVVGGPDFDDSDVSGSLDDDDLEEEDEDDDDDDDEEAPDAVPLKGKQAALLRKLAEEARQAGAEEDDDDDDDEDDIDEEDLEEEDDDEELDDDEDMDDDDDDEEEEEEEAPRKSKRANGEQKRPAPVTPVASNKKAKTEAQTPSAGEGKGEAQWLKDIRAYIAKEGPSSLSTVGSNVKKPPGTAKKLKKLIEESSAFTIGADLVVSIKK